MKKYVCSVCGYVYDEQKEAVRFDDLPANWVCPLCGAPKSAFNEMTEKKTEPAVSQPVSSTAKSVDESADRELSNAELNVLCTNLAKGCEKQYRAEEASLFGEIADYYRKRSEKPAEKSFDDITTILKDDLASSFGVAFDQARADGDRGALRVLTWSEKVSKIVDSLLSRYRKEGTAFLQNTKIFVCEICGFIYIGDEAPEICPICKVPRLKIHEVGRI
ncbi:MAG: rubredoxin [Clostridia bacterium]